MKTLRIPISIMLLAFYSLSLAQPGPQQADPPGRRVLIGFREGTGPRTPDTRAAVVRNAGGQIHASFALVPVVSARLPEPAIASLSRRPDVAYVEDDVKMSIVQASEQTIPWGVNRIDADNVWAANTGAGVNVAILDTGIDHDHPDLQANVQGGIYYAGWIIDEILGYDGSTNPAYWNDGHGHGTHCAGIVAAANNAIGVVGVAPDAFLYGVKVLGDDGSGYTSDIIQGIEWCADNGIDVASMSFGGSSGTASLQSACQAAFNAGVFLVGAAGNDYGGPVIYPAAYNSVTAVSAVGQNPDGSIYLASFSNVGPEIALAGPGVSINSTFKDGGYYVWGGTSMACPHVAGAAALVWASGASGPLAVQTQLWNTAEDLGPLGWDASFGYGLVDAQAAAGTGAPTPLPPVADFSASPTSGDAPLTVDFTDLSTGSPTSWSWTFGDGGTSTDQNPSHTYIASGTFTVQLTATNSAGADTLTKTGYVSVTEPPAPVLPVADFSADPTSGDAPLTVNFTDLSANGPTSWSWAFGDGGTSTDQNPSYTYDAPGNYTVVLMASNSAGDDTVTKTDHITVTQALPAPAQTVDVSVLVEPWITFRRGRWKAAAWVTVSDPDTGFPVLYTTIEGQWTGLYNATVTGSTDDSGLELFTTKSIRQPGDVTFTVTRILSSEGEEFDLTGALSDTYTGP
ncbi:MAG: S8 family serine peptidase [Planctomycetota bacterium]|jgi:subtilisin